MGDVRFAVRCLGASLWTLKGCFLEGLFFQNDARRVDIAIENSSRAPDLRPDGDERPIGGFGEAGIADRPAADFRGTIRERHGLAPGLAFIVRDPQMQRETQGGGAGVVGENQRAIAGAEEMTGA